MSSEQIENNLKKLQLKDNEESFIFDFLLAYQQPKSTIVRLKKGDYNLSKNKNQLVWKKKIFFHKIINSEDTHDIIDNISRDPIIERNKIRFIIVTNFKTLLAIDTKTKETLDIEIYEVSNNVEFFLPLAGLEKFQSTPENLADLKAATKMGKLFDIILKDNINLTKNEKDAHGLNIFFTRILFCFFAEDTGIFEKGLFTKSVVSYTEDNGFDLHLFLEKLFEFLNTNKRDDYPKYLNDFPYVNGGLFENNYKIPKFSKSSRKILIESGNLDWSSINPDILGSMMQAVVQQGVRKDLGMHYTSVQNILKVIKPLFLDDLYSEYNTAEDNVKKLKLILKKIYNIIIFDPACGSGNFLVISYKELYRLEIEILKKIKELDNNSWLIAQSGLLLTQFYGIEKDDYAHEAAKLSLWIAQHQMSTLYKDLLNEERLTLPLSPSANIQCANATLLNWEKFCPKTEGKIFFLIGNPPYLGSSVQSKEQKEDMNFVFKKSSGYKNLDYISCWFFLGAKYIECTNGKMAFISTSSICQGEQVSLLWPRIFKLNIEINFAYEPFKWSNSAKYNAGVTCTIISLKKVNSEKKVIYKKDNTLLTTNIISPYLCPGLNTIVSKKTKSISNLPEMIRGNSAVDGGNLILSEVEKNKILKESPLAKKFIRPFIGGYEYINNQKRYCIWIKKEDLDEATSIKEIKERIKKVKEMREKSRDKGANFLAARPFQFRDVVEAKNNSIIVPRHTSERREYIPIGFLDKEISISDGAHVLYDPPIYILSILSSKMHMIWVFSVGGYLGSGIRYSSRLCYNAFPFPKINQDQKNLLEDLAFKLIDEREKYSDKKLSELYDPKKMPENIKKIHAQIDLAVDKCYKEKVFLSDDERKIYLFKMYESIVNNELLL